MTIEKIVRLYGGLGNALFQFAWGRFLEARYGAKVSYDRTAISDDVWNRLNWIIADDRPPAVSTQLHRFRHTGIVPLGRGRLKQLRLLSRLGAPIVFQDRFMPLPDRRACKRARYFAGYFQHRDLVELVGRSLSSNFHAAVAVWRLDFQKKFGETPIVSIHVRRGDYLNKAQLETHGMLDTGYYERAIQCTLRWLRHDADRVKFLIFSDAPEAAKTLLNELGVQVPCAYFSDNWVGTDVDELCAMAACSAHIVANSTFSYWGALLGRDDGLRISPRAWFAKKDLNALAGQLFDDNWKRE